MSNDSPKTTDRGTWQAAYCAAFRRIARERGWSEENIESGWLDEWPGEAWRYFGHSRTPDEAASEDVPAAEWEAANA